MKFCSECGAPVERRIPEGDSLPRHVCGRCGAVHYQNPKIVVGCIAEWKDEILLCRRSIEPRRGLWTVPAGFMENGETTQAGALRETLEEANARVEIGMLYALHDLPYANQIYLIFRARLLDLDFGPGVETLEVSLFNESAIPWDRIAFRTVHHTLVHYYEDRRRGEYCFHRATIDAPSPRLEIQI
jgi:ADP-ribose pyrophosphatase YjhB (NUDIX family)